MHRKLASQGLVVIAVNLDAPGDDEARRKALDFLNQHGATFLNLAPVEGEKLDEWLETLKFAGFPQTFFYNREGKLAKQTGSIEPKEMDQVVAELLNMK